MKFILVTALVGIWLLITMAEGPSCYAAPIGINSSPGTQMDSLYDQGFNALARGAFDAAEKAFQKSLQSNPQDVKSLLGLADVATRRKQQDKAVAYLQQALSLAPENPQVQTAWGRYLYSQKKYSEAETAFKKAISADSKAVAPRIDLGTLYVVGLKQPEQAVPIYRDAISIAPRHAGAHYALGTTLGTLGKSNEAIVELEESARLSPGNPLPYQALGGIFVKERAYAKALDAFSTALELNPRLFETLMSRGDLLVALGESEKALADYNLAQKVAPGYAPVLVKIGMIHQQQKNYPAAEVAYLDAIVIDDKIALAYNNLAYMAAESGKDLDNAKVWANIAVELAPEIESFQDTLGWVHRARGESAQALSVLQKAAMGDAPQAGTLYHLGVVYAERSDTANAIATFEKALTLHESFAEKEDIQRRLSELK